MCQCNHLTDTAEQWEARLEGRRVAPPFHEVDGPPHLVKGDEWDDCEVCTGCAEIRQVTAD